MRVIYSVWIGFVIIMLALALFSCNRKMQTHWIKTGVDSSYLRKYDSTVDVNKTLSEAYESLLQTTNSTDVVFECPPCDSGKVSAQGMPHIINRVTVDSKGNKVFEGSIKSYREAASVMEKRYYSLTQSYDSLAAKKSELENNYSKLEEKKNKVVKSTFIPIWLWIVLIIAGLLWLNERFSIIKLPFLTKK